MATAPTYFGRFQKQAAAMTAADSGSHLATNSQSLQNMARPKLH